MTGLQLLGPSIPPDFSLQYPTERTRPLRHGAVRSNVTVVTVIVVAVTVVTVVVVAVVAIVTTVVVVAVVARVVVPWPH